MCRINLWTKIVESWIIFLSTQKKEITILKWKHRKMPLWELPNAEIKFLEQETIFA